VTFLYICVTLFFFSLFVLVVCFWLKKICDSYVIDESISLFVWCYVVVVDFTLYIWRSISNKFKRVICTFKDKFKRVICTFKDIVQYFYLCTIVVN